MPEMLTTANSTAPRSPGNAEARAVGAFLTEAKGKVDVEWRPIVEG